MIRVVRIVMARSTRLSKRLFRVFTELEGMYRDMVEQLVLYAVGNNVKGYARLKA